MDNKVMNLPKVELPLDVASLDKTSTMHYAMH
jgi:hypothetical protein